MRWKHSLTLFALIAALASIAAAATIQRTGVPGSFSSSARRMGSPMSEARFSPFPAPDASGAPAIVRR